MFVKLITNIITITQTEQKREKEEEEKKQLLNYTIMTNYNFNPNNNNKKNHISNKIAKILKIRENIVMFLFVHSSIFLCL